jgi:hypothetical protein
LLTFYSLKTPSKWAFGKQVGFFRNAYLADKRWEDECGELWELIDSSEDDVSDDYIMVEPSVKKITNKSKG